MNKEIIIFFLNKGFLLSPDIELDKNTEFNLFDNLKEKPLVLDKELFSAIENKVSPSLTVYLPGSLSGETSCCCCVC